MSRKRSIQGIFSAAINFPQNESGTVKIYAQIYLQTPADLKSAGNGNVIHDRFQVLRVHVILVAPLGARHMAKPRADQHQGGISIGERPHHASPAAISRFSRSITLLVRIRVQCSLGKSQEVSVSSIPCSGWLLCIPSGQVGKHGLQSGTGRIIIVPQSVGFRRTNRNEAYYALRFYDHL